MGGDARGRRRRRWAVPLGVLAALAIALGAWLWTRRGADPVSIEESVDGFRDEQGGATAGTADLVPAPGVYSYRADGAESLSVLGTSQAWGATVPATVTTSADGCWAILIAFSTNHEQSIGYCADGRVLEERTGSTVQTFDFVATAITDTTEFTCDPPGQALRLDARAGDVWDQSCAGGSTDRGTRVTSAGTNTFVGPEEIDVGGSSVDALHVRQDRQLSGDQRGSERTDVWFHPTTGLPVRIMRDVSVVSPSPVGDVTYTESGVLALDDLQPRT